jgi:hypothetical protein
MDKITLRNIPQAVEVAIRGIAAKNGESLNKTIIALLQKSLGLDVADGKKRDLSKLAGTWTKQDELEFNKNIDIFEKIDVVPFNTASRLLTFDAHFDAVPGLAVINPDK